MHALTLQWAVALDVYMPSHLKLCEIFKAYYLYITFWRLKTNNECTLRNLPIKQQSRDLNGEYCSFNVGVGTFLKSLLLLYRKAVPPGYYGIDILCSNTSELGTKIGFDLG